MDRTALLLYVWRVEGKFLDGAREAHALGTAIQEADLVDEEMLIRRARVLDGVAETHRDDLRVLRHPLLVGRWCIAVGVALFRFARALR